MTNKIKFTTRDQILRMLVIAFLLALSYVLMILGEYLPYPPVPFLQLEPSDMVVLLAYSLYGFFASAFVAFGKTALQLITVGIGAFGSPIPVGAISAFIASLCYSLGLLIVDKVFRGFSKGLIKRIISYVFIVIFVSTIMTLLNYLFITPTYLVFGAQFLTVFDVQDAINSIDSNSYQESFKSFFSSFGNYSYALVIFLVYFPFNLLKGVIVTFCYEVIFNKVIYVVLKSGRIKTKMFLKRDDINFILGYKKSLLVRNLNVLNYEYLICENGIQIKKINSSLEPEDFISTYFSKETIVKDKKVIKKTKDKLIIELTVSAGSEN